MTIELAWFSLSIVPATVLLPVNYPEKKVKPVYFFTFRVTKTFGSGDDNYYYLRSNFMFQSGTYFPIYKGLNNTGQIIYQQSSTPTRFYNNFLQIQAGISLSINKIFQKREDKNGNSSNQIETTAQ